MLQHNTTTVVVQHVQNGQTIRWLQWQNIADTLCTFKTPSPYEQLLPLPTTCFKMFWKGSLMIPHHPTLSIFHCYPLPIHHPSPSLKILIIHLVQGRRGCRERWLKATGWYVLRIILACLVGCGVIIIA